jgi:hypothetical protein
MGVKLPLVIIVITFTILTVFIQISLTQAIGLNGESVSPSSDFSVIDFDCTIVNIDFTERENQDNIEWTINSRINNQHELLEEEIRRTAAARILLLLNNSNSNNLQELKRPISQKAVKQSCFQAILVVPNSLGVEQLKLNLKFLKENIIPVNQDPILIPNQDKLLILAGSRELLHSTFKSNFGLSFKYKAGLILSDPSFIYYSQCRYCENSEQTFALLSSRELWKDYESNMNNYPLKVTSSFGAKIRMNYTLIDGSSSIYRPTTGSYVPCISFLQQKLNFTYTIHPISSTGIEYPNGTWTGQVNEVLSGNADFATCVAETFRRHTVAEFSPTVFYEPIALITGHPNKEFVWYAIFWPLSPSVWAMIGVCSCLSVILIYFLVKNHRHSTKGKDKPFTWKMDKIMEYIGQSFLGQFDALPPQRQEIPPKIRVFLTVWLFFSFLVTTFYLSMLVGFLTFPVYEKIPETGEELAANPDFKVGITYIGGAFSTFLRTSKSPMIMNLANRMELNSPFLCIRSSINEKKVCLGYEIMAQSFIHTDGLLSPEGRVLKKAPVQIHKQYLHSFPAGFLMAKRSVIVPNFSATVSAALSAGLLGEWERQDFRNKRLQTISNAKTNNNVDQKRSSSSDKSVGEEEGGSLLTFKHLKGAFLILLGGLTLSSVCMTLEFFFWGWKERQKLKFKTVAAANILTERIRKIGMHEIRT